MADIILSADVTLNGKTCQVTVNEDTDGDGTAENSTTQTLSDGSNNYTLSGFSGTKGNDWFLDILFDTDDDNVTPELRTVSIEVP